MILMRKQPEQSDTDVKGRMGGLARAKKLTPARRKEIAIRAAETRWKKKSRIRIEIK
jgi:hypothetical protein